MYKSKFKIPFNHEVFEAYTDGSFAPPCFTREQASAVLDETPYDYRFLNAHEGWNDRDFPILYIYYKDAMIIESTPLPTDGGDILEGYFLDQYDFEKV
jgi:hypothetical protein